MAMWLANKFPFDNSHVCVFLRNSPAIYSNEINVYGLFCGQPDTDIVDVTHE